MASGLDALIEALKQSGMNMDGEGSPFGEGPNNNGNNNNSDKGNSKKKDSSQKSDGGKKGSGRGSGGRRTIPPVEIPFADRVKSWGTKGIVLITIIAIVLIGAAYWWFHPPINIHSLDTWFWIAVIVIVLFFVFWTRHTKYKNGAEAVPADPKKAKRYKGLLAIPIAIAAVGVIGGILSLSLFPGNAERYSSVLVTDELEFAQDIHEVNYSEVPVIDRDSAILLGNREMGTIPDYVSQFEISTLYSQINYHREPVRVSPLNYADLFKWFTNRNTGIPAYALVNMTTQDAEIVRLGDTPIYYSQSEPLERNIDRYIQLKYPFYIFDEFAFEIDEDGHPWWICPVRDYTIGLFGGETIDRVVLCDATTGECQELAVQDCPEWVDRVYPAELLIKQYNWYGSYHNGWLNSFLGQEGVVRTTPGSDNSLGYNYIAKDDDVWVYTGVTSATADNSIIGFVLINQRTQESHFYSVSGATEESAMGSAQGQVQNLRYTATFPLLINVANQPTYFMALKDAEGLVKKFAMVDIQRYQNVATGDTVADTQRAYEVLLATNGVNTDANNITDVVQTTGVIRNMAQAVVESNSHFYVTLEDTPGIFDFALPGLIEIVTYREGDTITFTYLEGENTNPVYSIIGPDGQETATGEAPQADDTVVSPENAGDTADIAPSTST